MASIVFLFGRPGSGKSYIARCIKGEQAPVPSGVEKGCLPEDWKIVHITDYTYLLQMFQAEDHSLSAEERCFEASECGGFNVRKFAVLEMALREVRDEALKVVQSSPKTLVLIEFARDKYFDALRAFGWANLSNAYFLYMNVELNTCIARVHKRASQRHYADDTFVTEEIMREYYKEDDLHRLQQALRPERIRVIDNNSNNQTAAWMTVRTAIQNWCLSQSGETRSLLVAHTLF